MSTPHSTTQSASERRSAEAQLRSLIDKFAAEHEHLLATTRRSLQRRLPTAHELVYEYRDAFVISFSPNDKGYEGVLSIRANADGIRLYFNRGRELPDPAKVLRGAGKQTRWIHVEDSGTLDRPEVSSLMDAAIAGHSVPFPTTGRGPMVIRSTSARQRRQSPPSKD